MGFDSLHRKENQFMRESASSDRKRCVRGGTWNRLVSHSHATTFHYSRINTPRVSCIRKSTTTGMTYRSSKSRWKAIINTELERVHSSHLCCRGEKKRRKAPPIRRKSPRDDDEQIATAKAMLKAGHDALRHLRVHRFIPLSICRPNARSQREIVFSRTRWERSAII